jgi:hypothetical protein
MSMGQASQKLALQSSARLWCKFGTGLLVLAQDEEGLALAAEDSGL